MQSRVVLFRVRPQRQLFRQLPAHQEASTKR